MKEGSAEGITEEVYVPAPEKKSARREESSLAKKILEFNRDALAVIRGFNSGLGEERKVELGFSKNEQADCEIIFKPIREKWVEDRKGMIEIENEEVGSGAKTFSTNKAGILDEYDVYIEFSSNQKFANTPELGLLTKLTVAKKGSNHDEAEPLLDAFVSLRDEIRDRRGQPNSYSRPKLSEDQELVFLEVAGLLRAVKEELQGA